MLMDLSIKLSHGEPLLEHRSFAEAGGCVSLWAEGRASLSWRDTQSDEQTLSELRDWNANGKVVGRRRTLE